jgi:hypothetical protein
MQKTAFMSILIGVKMASHEMAVLMSGQGAISQY